MYKVINGCGIYYEVHGNKDGETIFFIHGAPGLGDCRNDIKAFSSLGENYQLVFLDMRGSGRSAEVPPYTHAQWISDIDVLREELGIEQIHILGGSYGGFLALEYVLAYPKRVKSVMLRDTSPYNLDSEDSITRAKAANIPGLDVDELERLFNGQMKSNEELKRVFTNIQPLYTVKVDYEAIKQKMDAIYYHYETHNYAFSVNKKSYNLVPRLKEIQVPVLVTVGIHDWITPVESSDVLATNIPNNTYIKFKNSGHSPHLEENDIYIENVKKFLNEIAVTK